MESLNLITVWVAIGAPSVTCFGVQVTENVTQIDGLRPPGAVLPRGRVVWRWVASGVTASGGAVFIACARLGPAFLQVAGSSPGWQGGGGTVPRFTSVWDRSGENSLQSCPYRLGGFSPEPQCALPHRVQWVVCFPSLITAKGWATLRGLIQLGPTWSGSRRAGRAREDLARRPRCLLQTFSVACGRDAGTFSRSTCGAALTGVMLHNSEGTPA